MNKRQVEAARMKYERARMEYLKAVAEGKMKILISGMSGNVELYEALETMNDDAVKKISNVVPEIVLSYLKSEACKRVCESTKDDDKKKTSEAAKKAVEADSKSDDRAEEKATDEQGTKEPVADDKPAEEKTAGDVKQETVGGSPSGQTQSSGYNQNGIFQGRKW